jgi:cytochrome d ubiquinol oxidase subunit II
MWESFWDTIFSIASLLLVLFFGAALGNVVRGVPLDENGIFFEPLWTTFTVVPEAGILDWFTVLMGTVAIATLTTHGANFVVMKTEGLLAERARRISHRGALCTAALSVLAIISTFFVRPELWDRYLARPWGFLFPLLGMLALAGMHLFRSRGKDVYAFLSSALFIAGMGGATAFGMYPNVLPASTNSQYNLTIYNTSAGQYGLQVGLIWWLIGLVLTLAYFSYLFYSFRGKVKPV